MKRESLENPLKTVISGSYRKHLRELIELKKTLEDFGVLVLSPSGNESINPGNEFVLLNTDPSHDHRVLQDSVFSKIRMSSFLVVANIDGYLGRAAVLEMGYAISYGLQIFTLEPVTDPNIIVYCRNLHEIFPKALVPR
jgi:hypothetical protein